MQYVDPSSSGFWYQGLLIALSAVWLFWSRIRAGLTALWSRLRGSKPSQSP